MIIGIISIVILLLVACAVYLLHIPEKCNLMRVYVGCATVDKTTVVFSDSNPEYSNNPVMYTDPTREFPWVILIIAGALVATLSSCSPYPTEPVKREHPYDGLYSKLNDTFVSDSYEKALEQGYEDVFSQGVSRAGEYDAYCLTDAPNGMEYMINIYQKDDKYYITEAYTSNCENMVRYKPALNLTSEYTLVALVHYHPKDVALSPDDKNLAYRNNARIYAITINGNRHEYNGRRYR